MTLKEYIVQNSILVPCYLKHDLESSSQISSFPHQYWHGDDQTITQCVWRGWEKGEGKTRRRGRRMKVEKGRGGRRVEEIGGRGKETMKGESLEQHNVLMTQSYGTMWPMNSGLPVYKPFQTHRLMLWVQVVGTSRLLVVKGGGWVRSWYIKFLWRLEDIIGI